MTTMVTIKRRKIARNRLATGSGFAWRYLYDSWRSDGSAIVYGADRLATTERMCREAGVDFIREWEARADAEVAQTDANTEG